MAAATPLRLAEIAEALGREVEGDGEFVVSGVAPLESAGECDLSFVRGGTWAARAADSRAGALILPDGIDPGARPAIRSPNPALDFALVVGRMVPASAWPAEIDPSAVVADDAVLHPSVRVGPRAVLGPRVSIGAGSVVHANATLYPDVQVGEACVIHAGCVLREGTQLGDRVVLQPGVVLGGDGFGYVPDAEGAWQKVPQVGRVVVEDDVEIGANTTVDRATLVETRIRRGAKIDNLVQLAHNCEIGEDAIVVAQTGLSGSTIVGRGAVVMAQAGSAGHLRIGERAFVGARAGLHRDVPDGGRAFGAPQLEDRQWHRSIAAFARLPQMLRRLRRLERVLGVRHRNDGKAEPAAPEVASRNGSQRER